MLVVCNNKNKDWCPHKKKDCECDVYYLHELKNGENRHISCIDINYDWQDCYLEEIKRETKMTNEEILPELREEYEKCNELFNIAYEINSNENTRTAFTQKVTTYISDVLQTISFLIGEFEDNTDIPNCAKNCLTCKNHHANIPHTCDICTSLDQDEEYGMWVEKTNEFPVDIDREIEKI